MPAQNGERKKKKKGEVSFAASLFSGTRQGSGRGREEKVSSLPDSVNLNQGGGEKRKGRARGAFWETLRTLATDLCPGEGERTMP